MLNAERVRIDKVFDLVAQRTSIETQNVVRFFPDVSMANSHQGLGNIAKEANLNVRKLRPGEYLIFMNKKQTALKMLTAGNIIAYLKMPGSTKIDPRTIALIPKFFNGTEINYSGALKKVLVRHLASTH